MQALWIALLSSSAWGIINAVVAGWLVRKRTQGETVRLRGEARDFETRAEERIVASMQVQIQDLLARAAGAEERAATAIEEAHLQGERVLALIRMFEAHLPWDRAVLSLLKELGADPDRLPPLADFDPYSVLNKYPSSGRLRVTRDTDPPRKNL